MSENSKGIVRYTPHCSRGDIIALLYNHAVPATSGCEIQPEVAEELVRKELGDVRDLYGKTVPSQCGFVEQINGISLNVYCYDGAIDVSGYPYGDGAAFINGLISKRISDSTRMQIQSTEWKQMDA